MNIQRFIGLVVLSTGMINAQLCARVSEATVERTAQGTLQLHWCDANPVDVYVSKSATLPDLPAL